MRFFSRQDHCAVCGRNRSTNRWRRCERRSHKGKIACKHPLRSRFLFELGGGPFRIRERKMVWLYPDRMHVRRLAKHLSDLKLDKAVLKTGDREGPAQALLE